MTIQKISRLIQWSTFGIGGAINTVLSYSLYLLLHWFFTYQVAYFFAYAFGVSFSYWFNATFVFRISLSWKGLFSYPLVYAIQYVASAILLGSLVEVIGITERLAPLIIAVFMIPLTYMLSKTIIRRSASSV
jgi:putative flippase GtrA